METKKKNTARNIIIAFLIVGAIIIAVPFFMGMYIGITSHTGTTGEISKTLEENCNCEKVNVDHSAYGIQFSRTDGLTGEKASYTLKNCKINKSFTAEGVRLNDLLVSEVEGYKDLDVVHLNFENEDQMNRIVIKKGKLQ